MFGPDNLAMRAWIYSLIDPAGVNAVLDIGCGQGDDLRGLGERLPAASRFVGVDISEKVIAGAKQATPSEDRFEFRVHDASQKLRFPDNSFDLVYSLNFLECVPDRPAMIREMHRLLTRGGQVVCGHFDWDTLVFDGADKRLVRKIVSAYADWQQAWMAAADGWMGRRLWREFQRAGGFEGKVETYVLANTEYREPLYGHAKTQAFLGLVNNGRIREGELAAFIQETERLAERGEFFFSINMYVYTGRKA